MNPDPNRHDHTHEELVALYVLQALPPGERRELEATISACRACQEEMDMLRPVVERFVDWPTDVLRPSGLWDRLAHRIGLGPSEGAVPPSAVSFDWQEAGPGISYHVLARDHERNRVSLLVRLAPGAAYPPHTHAGVEELYLLDGELWIDSRKVLPGEYNRGEPGATDRRVWSETGCTCVLLTSSEDVLH